MLNFKYSLPKRITKRDLAQFTSYLSEFLAAGIPLMKALQLLEKESKNELFQGIIREMSNDLRQGESFSRALLRHPEVFDAYYVQLVEAGETSGKLESVLVRLGIALEKEIELRSKIAMAFAYPSFVVFFGIFTIFFLMIFMVPKIASIYQDFGGEFPLITRVVLGLSHWFFHMGWVLALGGVGLGAYLTATRKVEPLKRLLGKVMIQIPWFKELIVEAEMVRFTRALSILLEGGVAMMGAIRLSVAMVTNEILVKKLAGIDRQVSEGVSLSESLRGKGMFPDLMLDLIWVGESTGNMSESLFKFTVITEKEIDRRIKLITTLIEPLIIVITGLIVGVIIIALLLPIFEMSLLAQ